MKNFTLSLLAILSIILPLSSQAQISQNMNKLSDWDDPTISWYSDVWGWHDGNGREYAILGSRSATHFIDITDPYTPVEVDEVAGGSSSSIWRDYKTFQHYCYAVSDQGSGSSLQIIDMSYLPDSVHVVYDSTEFFERAHNIYIDEEAGLLYVINPKPFPSNGWIILDLNANPEKPTQIFGSPLGYTTHDLFVRNDTAWASNGNPGYFVYDVSTPSSPSLIGNLTVYPEQGYNHASWVDETGDYVVMADETHNTGLKMVDVTDISNLTVVSTFRSALLGPADTASIAHNPYIIGEWVVASYYHDGVQVFNISDPANPTQDAWWDTYPINTSYPGYDGCWGVYPYLPSGVILGSDDTYGLFVLRPTFVFPRPITSALSGTNSNCYGASNGQATVVASGGAGPYTYNWSNGDTIDTANGLAPGRHYVTITDRWGFTAEDSIDITEPDSISLAFSVMDIPCNGQATGEIDLTVSGGSPSYTYSWTGGSTMEDISSLSAGFYTVTVTDNNGCTKIDSVEVVQPDPIVPSIVVTHESCPSAADGSIDLSVIGGTPPYRYSWSTTDTAQDISGLTAGPYSVTISDFNLCPESASETILTLSPDPSANFSYTTAGPDVTFTDLSADADSIWWDFGDGSGTDTLNPVHTYASSATYLVCQTAYNVCDTVQFCDSVNVVFVGIQDLETAGLRLWPNPSDGMLNIQVEKGEWTMEIMDVQGKLILGSTVNPQDGLIQKDLGDLPSGIYTIKLSNKENSYSGKWIRQ